MQENILEVNNLNMHYETISGKVAAVKDITFHVKKGESFGLVGSSAITNLGLQESARAITALCFIPPDNS